MHTLWQDVRFAVRMMFKSPGLTATVIFTLALGIGANTAIFSVVNGVLLHPLPYPEADRLVNIWDRLPSRGFDQVGESEGQLVYYREHQQAFEGIAGHFSVGANLTGHGNAQRVMVTHASPNLFPLLGVEPFLGRGFTPEEERPGRNRVLILAHGFWQQQFGGDPGVLGQPVEVDGKPYTIVGVMPPGFSYPPENPAAWVPLSLDPAALHVESNLTTVARLKHAIRFEQAATDIQRVAVQYAMELSPGGTLEELEQTGWGSYLIPLEEGLVGNVRPALLILMGAVALVLLIACANVANLQLVRAASREREMAIRASLGAGRERIARQLLTESSVLALAGGALGLLLAYWLVDVVLALAPQQLPRRQEIVMAGSVLGFTMAVSLLTGILFGLAPAVYAWRTNLQGLLKEGGHGSTGRRSRLLHNFLVVSEIALALVLLVGAGLLIHSFSRLLSVEPGYRVQNVLTARLAPPVLKFSHPEVLSFYERVLERVAALPGVESAAAASNLPLSAKGSYGWGRLNVERPSVTVPNRDPDAPYPYVFADRKAVTPNYFQTMGIPLLAGRLFEDRDTRGALPVAVVDEKFSRQFWPNESPLGRRIATGSGINPRWATIVGVVRHTRTWLNAEGRPQVYFSHAQWTFHSMYLVLRTQTASGVPAEAVRAAVRAVDPEQPVFDVRTMEQRREESVGSARFQSTLLAGFGLLALTLAAVGLYGVVSYTVSQRTHEIGVRMALGAQPGDVFRLMQREGMLLALAGTLAGLGLALALTRILSSLLFEVSVTDPATFLVVPMALLAVTALAIHIPARRATRVDPMTALRYE